MNSYALTWPQLAQQAIACKYAEPELQQLRTAYELAERLADGLHRAQGMPFLCHLTRVASIALRHDQPLPTVLAGLLHGVYRLHRHRGSIRQRASASHRAQVRQQVGAEAEQIVWLYTQLDWPGRHIPDLRGKAIEAESGPLQSALVLQVCNELEDALDLARAYQASDKRLQNLRDRGHLVVELAQHLGLPDLADELQRAYDENLSVALPQAVLCRRSGTYELPQRRMWTASHFRRVRRWLGKRARSAWSNRRLSRS